MNYLLASFLLSCLNVNLYGQTIFYGKVIDSNTKEGIPYAHIVTSNNSLIDISNHLGVFILSAKISLYDTVIVSCIGYKKGKLIIRTIMESGYVELIQDTVELNAITIHPLSSNDLVKMSITAIDNNYIRKETIINGMYMLSSYIDSTLIDDSIYPMKVLQKEAMYYPEIIRNESDSSVYSNWDVISESFNFDHIIYGRGFLNINNLDSWRFTVFGFQDYQNIELIVISANYISDNTVSHSGLLYINPIDYSILRIEFNYTWNMRNLKNPSVESIYINPIKWSGYATYQKESLFYTLADMGFSIEKEVYVKKSLIIEKFVGQFKSYNYDHKTSY